MATARANLRSEISLDASKFSATLRKLPGMANAAMAKVGQATARVAKAMGNLVMQTAKWGAILASVAIVGLSVKMVKLAASAEQTAVAFKVMTGSAGAAGKVLGDLRKMAEKTPFGFADLSEASKTLLAFGIESERIVPTMQRLGDISGGNAEKLKSVAMVYGQIAAAAKLTGGDLLQLINVGFNPLQQIAARTGESMGELRKRMEAGKISFDEFQQAVVDATSEGGRFFGMMEAQSKTAAGLFSTLQDGFDSILLKLGEPINARLVTFLEIAIAQTEKLIPMADKVGQSIGKWLDSITAQMGSGASIWTVMSSELEIVALKFGKSVAKSVGESLKTAMIDFAVIETAAWSQKFANAAMKVAMTPALGIPAMTVDAATGATKAGRSETRAKERLVEVEAEKAARIAAGKAAMRAAEDKMVREHFAAFDKKREPALKKLTGGDAMKHIFAKIPGVSAEMPEQKYGPRRPSRTGGPLGMIGRLAAAAQSMVTNPMTMANQAAKAVMYQTAGFSGLAGGATMQAQRLAGVKPGEAGVFAQDRGRLGIKSGLQTGGLGATKKVGRQMSEEARKEASEAAKDTNGHLRDIKRDLEMALRVG